MTRQSRIRKFGEIVETFIGDNAEIFILFVDLCGSTEYKYNCATHNMPELTWIGRQLTFLQRAADLIRKYNGIVVKTLGDSIMAIFDATTSPEYIIRCSIEILQTYGNLRAYQGNDKIEAKVSIDFGLTYNGSITETVSYDPIGTPVDRCARMNNDTASNEITFSQNFLNSLINILSIDQLQEKYNLQNKIVDLKGLGRTTVFSILAK